MSAVNLGTARILIVIALVAAGAVVLVNGFDDESGPTAAESPGTSVTSPGTTTSPPVTTSPSEPPSNTPAPHKTGVLFMVLNGTNVTGLAGEAQQLLEAEGNVAQAEADNAPSAGVDVTTVYYRAGEEAAQNKADATYIGETFFPDSNVEKLDPTIDAIAAGSVTVVVVVGDDFAQSVAA
jgi:hypothetical protein